LCDLAVALSTGVNPWSEVLLQVASRYESEPETKEGKKELLARAKAHEASRDHALR